MRCSTCVIHKVFGANVPVDLPSCRWQWYSFFTVVYFRFRTTDLSSVDFLITRVHLSSTFNTVRMPCWLYIPVIIVAIRRSAVGRENFFSPLTPHVFPWAIPETIEPRSMPQNPPPPPSNPFNVDAC